MVVAQQNSNQLFISGLPKQDIALSAKVRSSNQKIVEKLTDMIGIHVAQHSLPD
jgi:hypothetical protein